MMNIRQVKAQEAEEKAYLEKLQRNRVKAGKARKAYWQTRIDEFFLNGIMK